MKEAPRFTLNSMLWSMAGNQKVRVLVYDNWSDCAGGYTEEAEVAYDGVITYEWGKVEDLMELTVEHIQTEGDTLVVGVVKAHQQNEEADEETENDEDGKLPLKHYKVAIHTEVFVVANDMDDAVELALDNIENGNIQDAVPYELD